MPRCWGWSPLHASSVGCRTPTDAEGHCQRCRALCGYALEDAAAAGLRPRTGGGVERGDISEAYFYKNDKIYTGLTVVEYLLAAEGPGDGGVAVVPGSHKANLACPQSMKFWDSHQEHVLEVNGQAGDVVIFTETLTHGTLPWTAKHQRRAVLYKFSPGTLSYGSGPHEVSYGDYIGDMTAEERAVMEAPHIRRG